jgi:hypothetical protein
MSNLILAVATLLLILAPCLLTGTQAAPVIRNS